MDRFVASVTCGRPGLWAGLEQRKAERAARPERPEPDIEGGVAVAILAALLLLFLLAVIGA
jgi:hypothetical protein